MGQATFREALLFWSLGLGLLAVALLQSAPWWTRRRRARIGAKPFPESWQRILAERVPVVARLPAALQTRLMRHILVFIAEKPFIGCQGQAITDEVRITIAAHACLLLLGVERPDCYPRLRQILVYPEAFVVNREIQTGSGAVQDQRRALAGESWSHGLVILSWADVADGASNADDGRNVAIHEFAHQIDQDTGSADGRPWRPTPEATQRWSSVMEAGLERLRDEPSALIDAYAATDLAEFFAVVSEVFFEQPGALHAEAPAVYRELAGLYGVDPASW